MWFAVKAMMSFLPASMERANLTVLRALSKGSKIIEEAGGLEAYDRAVRSKSEHARFRQIITTMKEARN
jgi:hypothetical protein